MTLEHLLTTQVKTENGISLIPDFRVSVQHTKPEGVHIIIHPDGYDGDTLDFLVKDNTLTQL